jgi:hypothetical protein
MASGDKKVRLAVREVVLDMDPDLVVYRVYVSREGGAWVENFGSEAEMKAFLRGVKCGFSLHGTFIDEPVVSRSKNKVRFDKETGS